MASARQLWDAVRGDGCTNAPDFGFSRACLNHDRRYTLHRDADGTAVTRWRSDALLFRDMRREGRIPVLGTLIVPALYWSVVRVFGRRHWNKK